LTPLYAVLGTARFITCWNFGKYIVNKFIGEAEGLLLLHVRFYMIKCQAFKLCMPYFGRELVGATSLHLKLRDGYTDSTTGMPEASWDDERKPAQL